ncbi:unnamed protein product [Adineta steineri]|uniref:Histone deacetylase 11 n=2 Tax=Adineta steineri TaxID=433720 RepID=A0A819KTG7_9BILA|nr:unnamed protein product [Adineta steineri]
MTSPSDDTLVQFPKNTLYKDIASHQWPIIYCKNYNIGFLRLEKLHPFDSSKWGSIINYLRNANMITDDTIIRPNEATKEHLRLVHTQRYLSSLRWSAQVARVLEVAPIAMLPNFIVQWRVLKPLRYQTGGTILAGKLALERGWAINIGGGFHHCSSDSGGGFCAYADLTLLIKNLFIYYSDRIKKVLIVDLDAHQGNGHEHDFMNDERVFIMDMYNSQIYPRDQHAKTAIKCKIELMNHTDDKTYLRLLHINLEKSLKEFQPDFVVYNAGTDILEGDLLGNLDITPEMTSSVSVAGFDQLKNTVEKYDKDKRIFVLFCGTKDSKGHSWCPDCVAAEKPVEEAVKSSLPSNAVFIECDVGDRPSWKDPKCPFRTDPQTRLTGVPTLIEWGTSKRLVESQLLDADTIKILFEDD